MSLTNKINVTNCRVTRVTGVWHDLPKLSIYQPISGIASAIAGLAKNLAAY